MTSNIRYSSNADEISWSELVSVIERAPLGKRDVTKLETAFRNSAVKVFAWDGKTLIGAGRAISDGALRAAVFDMVVLPEYQGKGIGKEIMRRIMEGAGVDIVMLFAAPGKEPFYAKMDFHKMKTAMAYFKDPARGREKGLIE